MKRFIPVLAVCLVVGFGGAEEKKEKLDAAALVGRWKITEGSKGGEKSDAKTISGDVTINKETITIEGGGDKHVMKYKIDASKSPAHIDMVGEEGPAKDIKAEGIISIDGDTIKLAYVPNIPGFDAKRPEKFESTKENKAFLFTMKKAK